MKQHLGSNLLFTLAVCALLDAVIANPPGGLHWIAFVNDPSPVRIKLLFLAESYVWPALLSFCAITLFQLQFRLASSGANKRLLFAICVLASGAMLLGLRAISMLPNSGPSYVAGMAAGYTMMSRVYAVRMRQIFRGVRLPWPIWRGNRAAVQAFDRMLQERFKHGVQQQAR